MAITFGSIKTVFTADSSKFVASMKKADRALDDTVSKISKVGKSFSTMSNYAKAAWVAIGSAGVVAISKISTASQEVESLGKRLEFVAGSSEKAAKMFSFLVKEANRVGISLHVATDEFSKLSIAAKGSLLEGEGVRKLFVSVAEAASVMRMSNQDVSLSFLALGQMMSKGGIYSEELRRQLGERLHGAVALMSRSLGVTTAELMKMIEGGLSAELVLGKFSDTLHNEVSPGLEEASESLTAYANRTSNAWFELKQSVLSSGTIINTMLKTMYSLSEAVFKSMGDLMSGKGSFVSEGLILMPEELTEVGELVSDVDLLNKHLERTSALANEIGNKFRGSFSDLESKLDLATVGGRGSIEAIEVIRKKRLQKLEDSFNSEIRAYTENEEIIANIQNHYDELRLKVEEAYNIEAEQKRIAEMEKQTSLLKDKLEEEQRLFEERYENVLSFTQNLIESTSSEMIDWMTGTKVSFKDFANSIIKDMLRIIAQVHIVAPLMSSFSSFLGAGGSGGGMHGALGKVFGFASGGIISEPIAGVGMKSGNRYAFGEEGDEMITPMSKGASGKSVDNVNITINAVDSKSLSELLSSNPSAIVKPIVSSLQKGDRGLTSAIRGTI